jgi:hypothetical protein
MCSFARTVRADVFQVRTTAELERWNSSPSSIITLAAMHLVCTDYARIVLGCKLQMAR